MRGALSCHTYSGARLAPYRLVTHLLQKAVEQGVNLQTFTPVENVLVQSVAGAVGTMPLGCGFVGVVPALNFLLTKKRREWRGRVKKERKRGEKRKQK